MEPGSGMGRRRSDADTGPPRGRRAGRRPDGWFDSAGFVSALQTSGPAAIELRQQHVINDVHDAV